MPHSTNVSYEFGPYRLNLAQRVLTRDGEAVSLTPKATEILVLLVMNAGQLVEKDDLLKEVWPDTFVEESNLTQNIFTLRRALGDERADPKYIETVARRGYRFIASVKVHNGDEDNATGDKSQTEQQSADGDMVSPTLVVAVLPFVNATGDQGLEYLAEGITDGIINSLSRVSRLRVMSRSAVFRRTKTDFDPQQIGKELGASAVLVGTISARPTLAGSIDVRPAVGEAPNTRTAEAATQARSTEGERDARSVFGAESQERSAMDAEGYARSAKEEKRNARSSGISVAVELVDVATGWQLWGESFDLENKDLLQIQEAITRQLLGNLKLKLTGEEEKRITARYTENAAAYQAYLEGRYHWSRYTRKGIEKAIGHFRQAIELDPNYALAYAAIVDCYLRLATNYLPPEDDVSITEIGELSESESASLTGDRKVRLRFEWDWKGAERELRRAHELKIDYPAAHQWYAAFLLSQKIYQSSLSSSMTDISKSEVQVQVLSACVPSRIRLLKPTPGEQVQVCCAIAREQIDVGNYDAACKILEQWWLFGEWPWVDGLNQRSCADLLFTAGELAGCVASTKQLPKGQKHGEALLNGSIAVFEQLNSKRRAAEGRIELALCYYRQGLFHLGRSTLLKVLNTLRIDDGELRSLALIRLASLERHAGRLNDALSYLNQALNLVSSFGPWVSGRCYLELASSFKDFAISDDDVTSYSERAKAFYLKALHEFEAVGNHRLAAIVENNLGFLLLLTGHLAEAELRLLRARRSFDYFHDRIRCAQVDDSLARLYIARGELSDAQTAIEQSVRTMETGDEDVLLAESLTTKGIICCKLGHHKEAQKALNTAYNLASRCGDTEGAGRAILILVEEMNNILEPNELQDIRLKLNELLSTSQQSSIRRRVKKCLTIIESLLDASNV